ncbi:hypothetical protein AB4Y45_40785 [Paraburkholderia sp. EG287A]|uniref:hypothetical protein n=1 Tax=unclassified Paraburkholderia TaxID=2615204 RepID=UPI0034D3688D
MRLANLRQGRGDARHFETMADVIAITCHLLAAGYVEACPEGMAEVQDALVRCHRSAEVTGVWAVDSVTFDLLADLLTLNERQMRSAPFHVVETVNKRMLEAARAASSAGRPDSLPAERDVVAGPPATRSASRCFSGLRRCRPRIE